MNKEKILSDLIRDWRFVAGTIYRLSLASDKELKENEEVLVSLKAIHEHAKMLRAYTYKLAESEMFDSLVKKIAKVHKQYKTGEISYKKQGKELASIFGCDDLENYDFYLKAFGIRKDKMKRVGGQVESATIGLEKFYSKSRTSIFDARRFKKNANKSKDVFFVELPKTAVRDWVLKNVFTST